MTTDPHAQFKAMCEALTRTKMWSLSELSSQLGFTNDRHVRRILDKTADPPKAVLWLMALFLQGSAIKASSKRDLEDNLAAVLDRLSVPPPKNPSIPP